METKLSRLELEALYDVCAHEPRFVGKVSPQPRQFYLDIAARGLIYSAYTNVYTITDAGREVLKAEMVYALQVNIPGQPPLILRDSEALRKEILGGVLEPTFDLVEAGDYGTGDVLFSVEAKLISMYDLATLPEWEEV